eukprot:gene49192-48561_t
MGQADGDGDEGSCSGSSAISMSDDEGSEGEPAQCGCCMDRACRLRTARDCCQTPVCDGCRRVTAAGVFCKDCARMLG